MPVMAEPKRKPGRKTDPDSKRSKGEDRHAKPRKSFHAEPELFAALERFVASTRPRTNESETMRTALAEFLERRGFYKPPKADHETS